MLTVKELSAWLKIKESTLYLWASQNKIPCRRIHGLVRFEAEAIQAWLNGFETSHGKPFILPTRHDTRDLDQLIEASKREVYTSRHGETIQSSLIRKEDADGAI
ncbi:putative DNA-binding domain protein, Excisionase family (modular protein) [Nitrospira defluvii]|uniref:Putative DNA-binding domain protein, Excisionase family (Modular protein) n=1 Tax=Nitrospira defluvii TaxID=330214 RepID=D8PA56_9BACT|nr:putative DNA-binding domain protein, Excisionase family (modular protein) [Nitrospira defluvii]